MAGRPSGSGSQAKSKKKAKPRAAEVKAQRREGAKPSPEAIKAAKAKLAPPPPPWHPLPLAEMAIVFGFIAILVAAVLTDRDGVMAGFLLIVLGTAEFSFREHRHGFRSHSTVLAMILGIIVGAIIWRTSGLGRNACIAIGVAVFAFAWGLFDRAYIPRDQREADGSKPKPESEQARANAKTSVRAKNEIFKHKPVATKSADEDPPAKSS